MYNVDPFRLIYSRVGACGNGGIGTVEMLDRCNIIALVGGGRCPQFA